MTFAARTLHAWRNPHLVGFVALLFTALTLLAAVPHRHTGWNGESSVPAGAGMASRENGATVAAAPTVSTASSCALCDWLTVPGLPTAARLARLARTVPAFVAWVPAPTSPIRARVLSWQQPRGPPAVALS